MRHIVTISLVFFSLTQLAKADKVDSVRYLTERYCVKAQTTSEQTTLRSVQDLQDLPHFLLSNNQLSAIGVLSNKNCTEFCIANQPLWYSVTLTHPRNNSP